MPYPATNLYPQTSGLYPGDGVEVGPVAVTGSASSITTLSATVDGTVDPNDLATHYYFEYGTSDGYGSVTSTQSAGSGSSPVSVSAGLSGLLGGRLYHYRLVASSSGGTDYGDDATLWTLVGTNDAQPPVLLHEANRGQ